jgi:AcrR family transcriptional regulator
MDPSLTPEKLTATTSSPVDESPAERRRRKVRDAILEAAERVFSNEGETALSIRRLADEIDYSPAAIYKYFASKEALLEELKHAFFLRLISKMEDWQKLEGSFSSRAQVYLSTYVRTALEAPHHYDAAFSGVASEHADPGASEEAWCEFVASPSGQAFTHLVDFVVQGQGAGSFRTDMEAPTIAKSLWASLHGITALMIHLPHFPGMFPNHVPVGRENFIDFHCALLVNGLKPPSK